MFKGLSGPKLGYQFQADFRPGNTSASHRVLRCEETRSTRGETRRSAGAGGSGRRYPTNEAPSGVRGCRRPTDVVLTSGLNRKLKYRSVFGSFPAKLGPRTPLNGSGSKNGAERTHNQLRR